MYIIQSEYCKTERKTYGLMLFLNSTILTCVLLYSYELKTLTINMRTKNHQSSSKFASRWHLHDPHQILLNLRKSTTLLYSKNQIWQENSQTKRTVGHIKVWLGSKFASYCSLLFSKHISGNFQKKPNIFGLQKPEFRREPPLPQQKGLTLKHYNDKQTNNMYSVTIFTVQTLGCRKT